ncbi:GntP family permease [Brachyspira murdochii]|uniref:Gluconate transporter n=2 Tax=Brachyspira murdochii TaxID=84378 RepID=D5U959_BRAM5|nr:GntP family permease [Brachyspira murdochii]ADG71232.1 Gluconate transporter [Brachyspira murdochii DSM 12563]PPS20814.1 gluconate transporter [Brachyspira murdochii]
MNGIYIFGLIIVSVIVMIIAISKFKQHPFVVLITISILVGVLSGMKVGDVVTKVQTGFGSILSSIGIVIISGTIIGTILEKTGAALTMANTILKIVGKDRSVLTMGITGYITGIPVFCDSGFVILSPISKALAARSKISLSVMGTALSGGLYATHCLVPPTPGPIAMAGTLGANLGLVILVGLLISIPSVAASIIYAKKAASKIYIESNSEDNVDDLMNKYGKLPGALHSFSPILLPIVLIALKSIADFPSAPLGDGALKTFFSFIGTPVIALLLGIFLSMTLLTKVSKDDRLSIMSEGILNSASILAITGAGGSFGEILKSLPIAEILSSSLLQFNIGVFLPFIIAMLLKTAMGASTVSMIVTSSMMLPLMATLGFTSEIQKVLVIMAIGAGAMTVSHANDSYFWVVSQFSNMTPQQAYKCQTGVTLVQGLTTIIIVFILSLIFK